MKKSTKIALASILAATSITLTGCNQQVFDTKLTFNKALIDNGNGTFSIVEIDKWCDYEGEQLQIITKDGMIIVVSSYNTKLFNDMNSKTTVEEYASTLYGEENIVIYGSNGPVKSLNK